MKTMDAFWWQLNEKLAKKTLLNQGQHSCDIWIGAKSHGTNRKLAVTWPDGSKSVESAHRVSFMTSNHFLKNGMSQVDAEGRQLLAYSPSNGTLFFGNNIKSKMGISNLIRNIYFNQKTFIKNIF